MAPQSFIILQNFLINLVKDIENLYIKNHVVNIQIMF